MTEEVKPKNKGGRPRKDPKDRKVFTPGVRQDQPTDKIFDAIDAYLLQETSYTAELDSIVEKTFGSKTYTLTEYSDEDAIQTLSVLFGKWNIKKLTATKDKKTRDVALVPSFYEGEDEHGDSIK